MHCTHFVIYISAHQIARQAIIKTVLISLKTRSEQTHLKANLMFRQKKTIDFYQLVRICLKYYFGKKTRYFTFLTKKVKLLIPFTLVET